MSDRVERGGPVGGCLCYDFPLGARVRLSTDSEAFADFARRYLAGFNSAASLDDVQGVELQAEICFNAPSGKADHNASSLMLSRGVRVDGDTLHVEERHFALEVSVPTPRSLELRVLCRNGRPLRTAARRLLTCLSLRKRDARRSYQKALCNALLAPLLANCLHHGYLLSHGSAFTLASTAVVIYGTEGIGKSSVGHAMVKLLTGATLMSDNWAILKPGSILRFPMPVRLRNDRKLMQPTDGFDDVLQIGRYTYYIPRRCERYCYDVDRFVLLRLARGEEYRFEEIPAASAVRDLTIAPLKGDSEFPYAAYTAFLGYLNESQFVPTVNSVDFGQTASAFATTVPVCSDAGALTSAAECILRDLSRLVL